MAELHLLRLTVDPAGLARLARARGIGDEDDAGYRLHALWAGLWGGAAPAPWRLDAQASGRNLTVWAYAEHSWETMLARAHARFADPHAVGLDHDLVPWLRGALAWEGCGSKSMPTLSAGQRVGFDLRTCATVRLRRDLPGLAATTDHGAVQPRKDGDECDVHVAEALKREMHPAQVNALPIYHTWLAAAMGRLTANGCGTVDALTLTGQRHVMVQRQHHARRSRQSLTMPEVLASGTLTIADPVAFAGALARGVGRHRAFGFGMLLLKRADC